MGAAHMKYFVHALVLSVSCALTSLAIGTPILMSFGVLLGSLWVAYLAWEDQRS